MATSFGTKLVAEVKEFVGKKSSETEISTKLEDSLKALPQSIKVLDDQSPSQWRHGLCQRFGFLLFDLNTQDSCERD